MGGRERGHDWMYRLFGTHPASRTFTLEASGEFPVFRCPELLLEFGKSPLRNIRWMHRVLH